MLELVQFGNAGRHISSQPIISQGNVFNVWNILEIGNSSRQVVATKIQIFKRVPLSKFLGNRSRQSIVTQDQRIQLCEQGQFRRNGPDQVDIPKSHKLVNIVRSTGKSIFKPRIEPSTFIAFVLHPSLQGLLGIFWLGRTVVEHSQGKALNLSAPQVSQEIGVLVQPLKGSLLGSSWNGNLHECLASGNFEE